MTPIHHANMETAMTPVHHVSGCTEMTPVKQINHGNGYDSREAGYYGDRHDAY